MKESSKIPEEQLGLFKQVGLHVYRYFYSLSDVKKDREKRDKIVTSVAVLLYQKSLGPRKKHHFTKQTTSCFDIFQTLGVSLEQVPTNFLLLIDRQMIITVTIGLLENTRFGEEKKKVKKTKKDPKELNKTIKYSSKKNYLRMKPK